MAKSINVPMWVVVSVVCFILTAILGYVAFEYGSTAIPQFVFFAFAVVVVLPLVLLFFGS